MSKTERNILWFLFIFTAVRIVFTLGFEVAKL